MNKITATGRLAADAELRYTPKGEAILNFRLASDVGYGDKKTTNWFACQVWGKRGEALAQHLTKGQQVTVFGSLTLREWTGKDGGKQLSPDIRIDEIELQGGKSAGKAAQAQAADDDHDPIPF
jgi:single-strand DNA-binding protein